MKTTTETVKEQEVKSPFAITLYVAVPYALVIAMAFSAAGLITGWFMFANISAQAQSTTSIVSKTQSH